jgi:allophanate hydrolase subunit 2
MVTGAVQLPPGGEPIVLGPDHTTLGGYPVPVVVIAADHGLLGQCAPGTAIRLVPVGFDEAAEALQARRRMLARAVEGHYPLAAG